MKEITTIFQILAILLQTVTGLGYGQEEMIIHNYHQKFYMLEVQMDKQIEVVSSLSQKSVFGFDTLGNMARENNAVAGVNGMFFDGLGSPAGLLCENKEWIRISDIHTPSLVIEKGQPRIEKIKIKAYWQADSKGGEIYALNIGAYPGMMNVFTRYYGSTNRVFRPQVSYVVKNNIIVSRYITDEPVEIEADFVISYLLPDNIDINKVIWGKLPLGIPDFEIGQGMEIRYEVRNLKGKIIYPEKVYQGGGWLLENGNIKAKPYEEFIGYTTSLQPRTAVGINQKGNLMFFVVDGRKKGIADGVTGEWLAEMMKQYSVREAMYLDGGASSMMWIKGGLVNQPAYSNQDEGKEIAHSILFKRNLELLD